MHKNVPEARLTLLQEQNCFQGNFIPHWYQNWKWSKYFLIMWWWFGSVSLIYACRFYDYWYQLAHTLFSNNVVLQVEEYGQVFMEHANKLVEVANLACSMSSNEEGVKLVRLAATQLETLCPQVRVTAVCISSRGGGTCYGAIFLLPSFVLCMFAYAIYT